ncbi:MAG TPA: DUF4956 domain-containing protein [Pseudomonadales bacterium]|nr:DUF4956 domain-containing protein [Pseudomonadales bacterium]
MRRANRYFGPLLVVTVYYGLLLGLGWYLRGRTDWAPWLPFGGIDLLAAEEADSFELITSPVAAGILQGFDATRLGVAMLGAVLVMVPVSWVYFITTRAKSVDPSFVQTIIILPIVVAGIASVVANSLALAFSLAGIFAAVRFRFTLEDPAHALYIFLAIVVGLGAGVGALGVAIVTSIAFVYVTLLLWTLEYGADRSTAWYSFLTGHDPRDDDL